MVNSINVNVNVNVNVQIDGYTFENGVFYGKQPAPPLNAKYYPPGSSDNPANKRPRVDKAIHLYTTKLLNQAAAVARAVKKPIPNPPRPFYYYSPFYTPRTNIVVVNNYGGGMPRNNDDAQRAVILLIGLVVLGIGTYALSKLLAKNDNLDAKINDFALSVRDWDDCAYNYQPSPEFQNEIQNVIDLTQGIMDRKKRRIVNLICKFAIPFLIGGALLVSGALIGASAGPVLVALGALFATGSLVYARYRHIKDAFAYHDEIDSNEILKKIAFLKGENPVYKKFELVFQFDEVQSLFAQG